MITVNQAFPNPSPHCCYSLPPLAAFRWIFNFFLCHVPPGSQCVFQFWEPTFTFLSFTGCILQVRVLVFPLFEELWPPALWQPPSDPTSLPFLIKHHTWNASKIYLSSSKILFTRFKLSRKLKNVSVEEAKPQHDPQTVSLLFLKFHVQLSAKCRNFSQCLGQLRVRGSRWAQWAPWNSRFTARAGEDCWTDTCTAQLLPASTHTQRTQQWGILQHVLSSSTNMGIAQGEREYPWALAWKIIPGSWNTRENSQTSRVWAGKHWSKAGSACVCQNAGKC